MIKKINNKILIFIILIIPFNQILWNYLFKIKFFEPIKLWTNYFIQPTLIVNLIAILFFSLIVFYFGRLELKDFFVNKKKIKQGLLLVLIIWILSQIFSITYSVVMEGHIEITDNLNVITGSFLGQLFGNATFEEGIYRGLFLTQFFLIFKQKQNSRIAIFISVLTSQLLFSIIHIPNRLLVNQVDNLLLDLIMIFIIGVIFSLVYIKTQNLIFLIGVHSLINIPFTLNKTDFPIALIVLLFTILISIFWNKFMEKNKGGFWKYDMVKE